jgi:GT2 family glycosyltransferase/SAM-dependent methyltransferase
MNTKKPSRPFIHEDDAMAIIEMPPPDMPVMLGRSLMVSGWAIGPAGIDDLRVDCGGAAPIALQTGLRRSDVAMAFPDLEDAGRSGFLALIDLQGLPCGAHDVTVRVTNRGGSHSTWSRRIIVGDPEIEFRNWLGRQGQGAVAGKLTDGQHRRASVSVVVDVDGPDAAGGLWHTLLSIDRQDARAHEVILRWGIAAMPVPASVTRDDHPGSTRITAVVSTLEEALAHCSGESMCILHGGDRLDPGALSCVQSVFDSNAETQLAYSDHDHFQDGQRQRPAFKPGWSPLLLDRYDYIGPAFFIRHKLLVEASAAQTGVPLTVHGLLRAAARSSRHVAHIPRMLLSKGTASATEKASTPDAAPRRATAPWTVSVIIPSCMRHPEIVARCLDGVLAEKGRRAVEIIVVLNNVHDPESVATFFASRPVKLAWADGVFNWSAINNAAAALAQGDFLLFLNDDVYPMAPGWLDSMLELAARPDVGAVGATLRYPNGRIQHAGVRLSAERGHIEARHSFRHLRGDEEHVREWIAHDREQSAVTGACLLSHKSAFHAVGGFDEDFALVFNDVDYCLRLADRGLASVMAADTALTHHESISREGMPESEDARRFEALWGARVPRIDPFHHPNLQQGSDDWVLDPDSPPPLEARIAFNPRISGVSMSTDDAWQKWGEQDPYYGVITDEKFRVGNITEEAKHAFFESGRLHVEHVLATCRHRLSKTFSPKRILDFGCGVGRVLIPFAKLDAEVVVGVDVSEGMLAEARLNCDYAGARQVQLIRSDDELSELSGSFDLIHSAIVFQHIEVVRGRRLFQLLLRHLAPGGIAVLHVTYSKMVHAENFGRPNQPRIGSALSRPAAQKPRRLLKLIPFPLRESGAISVPVAEAPAEESPSDPEMQMNCYDLNDLLFMIQSLGVANVHLEFTDHGGELGTVLYFQRP